MGFQPTGSGRWVLRSGMSGWDVEAAEIALNGAYFSANLVEDGIFGPKMEAAVKKLQGNLGVREDGIIGPQTMLALCLREAHKVEIGHLPTGLLRGIIEGESGGQWDCISPLYPNGTRDFGPLQTNLPDRGPEIPRKEAFNVGRKCAAVRAEVAEQHALYVGKPGAPDEKEAWRLAILHYNWPAAADAIAYGHDTSWLDREQAWIIAQGVDGVRTGWEWATFYVNSKSAYITTWAVTTTTKGAQE